MSIEIRPIVEDEFEPFMKATYNAFGSPEVVPHEVEDERAIAEYDRTLAGFDGEEIVSTTGIFSFEMTVPGGAAVPTAGVTWVSVKPTHRRQGLLIRMMQQQLRDVRDRNEPIAALWASESIIYGRFGYGLAAQTQEMKIDRTRTALAHAHDTAGRMRLISRDEALSIWPRVYDRVLPSRPGMYSRSESWWRHHSLPEKESRGAFGGRFYVVYEEDGEPLGYARYRTREQEERGAPNGTLGVQELMAATDGAYTALWRYLFGVDLIGTIQARNRPVDEPLYWMLADPRRLVRSPFDALWVRVVDVPAALEARRYATEIDTVVEVRDPFCDWTEGRYRLEGGPDGASCQRTDADASITLNAADLGAAYMGGTPLSSLARAGRVEGDEASLRRIDAAFGWQPAPWTPEVF